MHYYGQPYWIQHFFNLDDYIGDCGGSDGDNEDSKVCTYVIQNATERDSGNYSCVSFNQISCTWADVYLEFQGTQQNFNLLLTSVDQFLYIEIGLLRAIAYKYRESHDRKENSDFLLLHQKDPFGELFSEIYFQSFSEFTFL